MNEKSPTVSTWTSGLSRGQTLKVALWIAIAISLAALLAIALASPVMTAFGMTSLMG